MYKKILLFGFLTILYGCDDTEFRKNKEIDEYIDSKYTSKLLEANVKFLKCYPQKDGTMRAVYTTIQRDNSFPAVVRFDYFNNSYNLYFDVSYLNTSKDILLTDIDKCVDEWSRLKESNLSWGNG